MDKPDVYEIRRKLRNLYESNPEMFRSCIEEIEYIYQLSPDVVRGKTTITKSHLSILLAMYLNRQKGVSREKFLGDLAEVGCTYQDYYQKGTWDNSEAILKQLKRAQKLVKSDADFKDKVRRVQNNILKHPQSK